MAARLTSGAILGAALAFCASSDALVGGPPVRVATAIRIELPHPSLEVGDSMVAAAVITDATGEPIPGLVAQWESANPTIVQVSSAGVLTAIGPGATTLVARFGQLATTADVMTYVRVAAAISIFLPRNSLEVGDSMVVLAVVTDSNGVTIPDFAVQWESADPTIAQVSSAGVVTAVASGATTLTARFGQLAATADIVTYVRVAAAISIVLPRSSLQVGDSMVVLAVVTDSNGVTIPDFAVQWESANPDIAQVSSAGVVTAIAPGTATLSAKVDGVSATVDLQTLALPPPSAPTALTPPELPRRRVTTTYVAPTGSVRQVRAGDNLQRVIDAAARGDVIELEAGAVFAGHFVLRAKPGTGWITIRTASPDAVLPPEGTRVRPSVHQSLLARLETPDRQSVITTDPGASHYRLIGLEITAQSSVTSLNALVQLGDGSRAQSTVQSVPSDLIIDRSYIHGHNALNLQRCVALNSASSAVIDSHLSECHAKGFDSQAIEGWNGPGPYKIENNYLEGAGENVMFGGADSNLPELMPADIEIIRNHFYKPLAWKGLWTVKNLLELKVGQRILIEGNVFEHCWVDGQAGLALSFKSVNQGGRAPWSQTSDITFRYNLVRRAAAGMTIAGKPSSNPAIPISRFLVEHNVFDEIGDFGGKQNGRMIMLMNQLYDIEIRHNTMLHNAVAGQFILFADRGPVRGFVVRDNIATKGGQWGAVMGGNAPQGTQALAAFAGGAYTFTNNVIVGLQSNQIPLYPAQNFFVPAVNAVGLTDIPNGDYRLTSSSRYYAAGTRASSPGADWALVSGRISGVVLPP